MEINGSRLNIEQARMYSEAKKAVAQYQPLTLHEENRLMQVFLDGVQLGLKRGRQVLRETE